MCPSSWFCLSIFVTPWKQACLHDPTICKFPVYHRFPPTYSTIATRASTYPLKQFRQVLHEGLGTYWFFVTHSFLKYLYNLFLESPSSLFKYHLIEKTLIILPKRSIPNILTPVPALIFLVALIDSSSVRVKCLALGFYLFS